MTRATGTTSCASWTTSSHFRTPLIHTQPNRVACQTTRARLGLTMPCCHREGAVCILRVPRVSSESRIRRPRLAMSCKGGTLRMYAGRTQVWLDWWVAVTMSGYSRCYMCCRARGPIRTSYSLTEALIRYLSPWPPDCEYCDRFVGASSC